MKRRTRGARAWSTSLVLAVTQSQCGGAQPEQVASWQCPADWVALDRGGCGPILIACAPGAAGARACAGIDRSTPRDNGAPTAAITRSTDGQWSGPWSAASRAPDADWAPAAAAQLAAPWVPVVGITECALGWTRAADGSCSAPVPSACEAGRFASVGRCVPAAECVAIESATTPVGAHVRYVSASATSEGDGSRGSPFATIGRAMDGAPADAWIVLDAGTYRATLTASHAVNILGVCASRVTIEGDASAPTLSAGAGASVLVRNVSVRGASELGVINASAGASVTLEDSAITGGVGYGVFATGAGTSVTVVRSAIRGMRARSDGRRGWSVNGEGGARVRVEQSHIGDGTNIGVNASGRATSATVVDAVIESIRTGRTPGQGIGVSSDSNATMTVERSVLRDIVGIAAYASAAGALTARSLQVSRIGQDSPSQLSSALYVSEGGRATVEQSSVVDTASNAAIVRDAGSTLALRSSVLRQLGRAETERTTAAIGVLDASVELTAIRAMDVRYGALRSEGGAVTIRGMHVSRAGAGSAEDSPSIAFFSLGGTFDASEVVADEHRGALLGASNVEEPSSARRVRVRFADASGASGASGYSALYVFDNAGALTLSDALIERCPGAPCIDVASSQLALSNVILRDFPAPAAEASEAIAVHDDGVVRGSNLVVDSMPGVALRLLSGGQATLDVARLSVSPTALQSVIAVGERSTLDARALTAAGAARGGVFVLGGSASVEDARIETASNNSSVALQTARGGSLTARRIVAVGAAGFAVVAQDLGTSVTIDDARIDGASAARSDAWAIAALDGASVTVNRAVIQRVPTALTAVGAGSVVRATDVFVDELRAREDVSNASVIAQVNGRVIAERVAISRGVGAAFATLSETGSEASLDVRDAFVGDMQLSRIDSSRPDERSNTGLFVRSASAVRCVRCAIRGASYGFMVARGALSMEDGAITESLDAAGLVQPDAPPVSLVRVGMNGNARNEVRNGALPDVSFALPTPLM